MTVTVGVFEKPHHMTFVNVDCCFVQYVFMWHHSGVELRRMGLGGTEEVEGSDKATVTPIFFREHSSVTEMERENAGRVAAS